MQRDAPDTKTNEPIRSDFGVSSALWHVLTGAVLVPFLGKKPSGKTEGCSQGRDNQASLLVGRRP